MALDPALQRPRRNPALRAGAGDGMTDRPQSLDGTLINAVEPIPRAYRESFLAELREADKHDLARCFAAHWSLAGREA